MGKYNPEEGAYCESKSIVGVATDTLHDWEIIRGDSWASVEYCKRCGLKTHFIKGNNKRYLETHNRDFLQPHHRLFEREWGTPNWDGKHGNS